MKYIVLFCIGILSVSWCPHLPVPAQVTGLLMAALAALGLSRIWRCRKVLAPAMLLLGAALAGAGWGSAAARLLVANQIPAEWQGQSIHIEGIVRGLPAVEAGRWQFEFEARAAHWSRGGEVIALPGFPRRLRLSWYYGPEVRAGQVWQLEVRLKPPRGLVNPGGFDYQRWLLSRGIAATGYIRTSVFNQQTGAELSVDSVREIIRDHLTAAVAEPALRGYLLALLLGDNSGVDARGWSLLQDFGLNHLLSISGLHISLSAAIGYLLFGYLARGLAVLNPARQLVPLLPLSGALALATGYCLLAGFTLPSQRSLVMVAVVLVCRCLYRDTSPWVGLGWALLCCVLLDPLAGYDSGFWLSFGAVAVLLLGIHGSGAARCPPWLQLLRVQWFIFVGLLIPLLLLGLPLSMLAPVANLMMVPLVSVAVVPLLLAGVMVLPLWPGLSALAWQVAGWVLGFSLQVLEYGRDLAEVIYLRSDLPLALLTAATVAVIPWLLPGLRSLRGLSLPALAALLWWGLHPPPDQHLRVTVLDVGQGLAVLIQQGERALLYDTGPGMGPALTAGSAVIVPFLRRQGVRELAQLVVSHNDVDHSGGLADVLEVIPVRQIVAGEPEKLTGVAGVSGCDEARQWRWAGSSPVQFTLLEQGQMARKGNDRSCVLLVEVGGWRLLVPGDIEAGREAELLTHPLLAERVDTLIAPHHGSRTSSTEAFLDRLHPRQVVVSSGFKNRFNHPHPLIVQRYKARGSEVLNTADSGAVSFTIGADGDISAPGLARRDGRRYWYAQPE